MAKTIMVSNEAYEKLKYLKERANKSFTEVIIEFISREDNVKKGAGLRECLGLIKKDEEWVEIKKELKKGWGNWSKKYA